jgi:glycosyltransferase involved in cell wall biosynthesis
MDHPQEQEISVGFFSFVGPNYSRSSTLLNFSSPGIQKRYVHVPAKFLKSINWIFKNRASFAKLDVLVVMSPCHLLSPVLKILTRKPVILDAGWSLTDGRLSRGFKVRSLYKLPMVAGIDFISLHSANLVLVESILQRDRVQKIFGLPLKKIHVSYTGLDESQFKEDLKPPPIESDLVSKLREYVNQESLIVLFRGKVNKEAGFKNICDAARILAKQATFIFILGDRDALPNDLENVIRLSNVSPSEMQEIYAFAHVAVGQISDHPRLKYTIPHKAFEAGYFKKAYVTSGSRGIKEIYKEDSVIYLSNSNPESLAEAILTLENRKVRETFEDQIWLQYLYSLSQEVINEQFDTLIRDCVNQFS